MFGELAAVIDDGVALVAGEADSFSSVELAAEGWHLAADSILVEVEAIGAFGALVLDPSFASVVIGDGDDIFEGDARSGGVVAVKVASE